MLRLPNFELRTQSHVTKINRDSTGKRATGVTYVDASGAEMFQPADLVILSSFQMNNVRTMLLSGIGEPYDPATGAGVIGKNFAYQMMSATSVFYDKDVPINPFIGAGSGGSQIVDEFNSDHFDHGPHGFVGGGYIIGGQTGGRPIQQLAVPPGTPAWGAAWKRAAKDSYLHTTSVVTHGSVMSYRDAYLDLDPTYRDSLGNPLLRMTFDWHDNEYKMSRYLTDRALEIVAKMNPKTHSTLIRQHGRPFQRPPVPDDAYDRRRHHRRESEDQCAEPLSAKLGCAQPVRHRRFGVPAEYRIQPDRPRRRSHLLRGGRDQDAVPEKSRPPGAGVGAP